MQTLPIGKIKANPNNPRTIKDDKFFKLVQSLKATKGDRPLLVPVNHDPILAYIVLHSVRVGLVLGPVLFKRLP